MIVYQNKDGEYLKPGGFTRLNGGKRLSRSQLALLGLKKVRVQEVTLSNGNKAIVPYTRDLSIRKTIEVKDY